MTKNSEAFLSVKATTSVDAPLGVLVSGTLPTFFRAACREARGGGHLSYRSSAYHLCRALEDLGPYYGERGAWLAAIGKLER
jgi:hypothetical protein